MPISSRSGAGGSEHFTFQILYCNEARKKFTLGFNIAKNTDYIKKFF